MQKHINFDKKNALLNKNLSLTLKLDCFTFEA